MKNIRFNEHINRVGIEFEGFWTENIYRQIQDKINLGESLFAEAKGDGSLSYRDEITGNEIDRGRYYAKEIITKPLKETNLNDVIKAMIKFYKAEDYKLNNSVGLHYHISLNKFAYGAICNMEFFEEFKQLFEHHFIRVYNNRKNNRYCSFVIRSSRKKSHFSRQSSDRYTVINYTLERHNTVEFRGYGGRYATIEGLARIIQLTIDLIAKYCSQHIVEKKVYPSKSIAVYRDRYNKIPFRNFTDEDINIKLDKVKKSESRVINLNDLPLDEFLDHRPQPFKSKSLEITLDLDN